LIAKFERGLAGMQAASGNREQGSPR
jgi:hypothetical protein